MERRSGARHERQGRRPPEESGEPRRRFPTARQFRNAWGPQTGFFILATSLIVSSLVRLFVVPRDWLGSLVALVVGVALEYGVLRSMTTNRE